MTWKAVCVSATICVVGHLNSLSLHGQSVKQLYTAGVNMGLASYHASIAQDEIKDHDRMFAARNLAMEYLNSAFICICAVDSAAGYTSPILNTNALKLLIENQTVVSKNDNYFNTILNPEMFENINKLIDQYIDNLTQNDQWNHYMHAYSLGVQMAIAEKQAAAGEVARQVVYMSLNSAKIAAQELDLDIRQLNECLLLSSGTAPMEDVYAKIVSLRSRYQLSL